MIGFRGTDCKEKDVIKDDPECPSRVQCKNGGTCWNNTCCCAKGYEGVSCQYDIDECKSAPCLNGGICKDEIGHYRCQCSEGMFFV